MSKASTTETVRVRARLQSLATVRQALDDALTRADWSSDDASRLMLAAGEAVCNAIEHGSVQSGEVVVDITTTDDGLTLTVTDEGDPGRPRRLDLGAQAPPSSSVRGRGIMIMRELADTIAIEPHERGTRVSMHFRRGEERAHRAA